MQRAGESFRMRLDRNGGGPCRWRWSLSAGSFRRIVPRSSRARLTPAPEVHTVVGPLGRFAPMMLRRGHGGATGGLQARACFATAGRTRRTATRRSCAARASAPRPSRGGRSGRGGAPIAHEGIGEIVGVERQRLRQWQSKGVPARRRRRRRALERDMPAARAARVTQPVSTSALRKSRCFVGVQRALSAGTCAGCAGGGAGVGCCSIDEYGAEEILHWKEALAGGRAWTVAPACQF